MTMKLRLTITIKSISALTIGLLLALPFLFSCSSSSERIFKETRPSMYTIVSITVVSRTDDQAQKAINASYAELERLAALLNFYSNTSEISAINQYAGEKPVKVSADTLDIIVKAVYATDMTNGALDVTVGPLVKLWDMNNRVIPDRQTIEEKLKIVGYKNIVL